jgi:hypothetical protein
MTDKDGATFLASFPPIQSAIKIGQDGMRIQLDIPETQMGNAIEVVQWRDCMLEVTIRPIRDKARREEKSEWHD